MELGEKVKKLREQRGLSKKEFSKKIGISQVYLKKIEDNISIPSAKKLYDISRILEKPMEYFLEFTEEDEITKVYDDLLAGTMVEDKFREELTRIKDIRVKEAIIELVNERDSSKYGIVRNTLLKDVKLINIDGSIDRTWEIEMEVLGEELRFYPQRRIKTFYKKGVSYSEFKIEGEELISCDVDCNIDIKIHKQQAQFLFYTIDFMPPLRKGQKARFRWKESHKNAHLMTREQILEDLLECKFKKGDIKEDSGNWIFFPTNLFKKRVIFPENYEIKRSYFDVDIHRIRHDGEYRRIEKNGFFTSKKENNRRILELNIEKPVTSALYLVVWEPPSEEEYLRLLKESK